MTQRKRAIGFALMDTAFAADAKFVRLARKAASPVEFAAAVGVFWLILADARRARSAIVNWDDYTEYEEQLLALKDAHLLTVNGFEGATFDNWAPAYQSPKERTQAYPSVPGRSGSNGTPEHGAYPSVPDGRADTESTLSSTPISSSQVPPPTKDAPRNDNFMGMRPKEPGIWNGAGAHDGRHGRGCRVCTPHPDRVQEVVE